MRHEKAEQVIVLARMLASSAEGLTINEMATALSTSRRTAERLRDAVERLVPQMEEILDGQIKRFRIQGGIDGFFQNPTTAELLALNKAAGQLRKSRLTPDADALQSLEQKIRSAMRSAVLRKMAPDLEALLRAEMIAVPAGPRPVEDAQLLATVRTALLSMRAVRFIYRGGSRPGLTREVAPYGIIFGRMNYLVGPEVGAAKIKSWRLDRISKIDILDQAASPPDSFSLSEFANRSFGFYQAEPEDVVLRILKQGVDDDFASWRFHPNETREPQADGSVIVRFRASGMLELAWHLFSWGNKVQIISPAKLREEMMFELRKASTHHEFPPPPYEGG